MTEERIWTDDMDEISGFGGGYEAACRAMVIAGLEWFDDHPESAPTFQTYEHVIGVSTPMTDCAKKLETAMSNAGGDVTGAMMQVTTNHVLWIHAHSWKEYHDSMVERKKSG